MLSLLTRCRRVVTEESGQAAVLAVICLFMVMGVMALAVDVGNLHYRQNQLETAADSAAIAAGLEIGNCSNTVCANMQTAAATGSKRRWHYRRHNYSDVELHSFRRFEFKHDH